jgi:hypothetical protein
VRLGAVPTAVSILTTSFSNSSLSEAVLIFFGNSILQIGDEVRVWALFSFVRWESAFSDDVEQQAAIADTDSFRAVAQCVSGHLDTIVDLACWVIALSSSPGLSCLFLLMFLMF